MHFGMQLIFNSSLLFFFYLSHILTIREHLDEGRRSTKSVASHKTKRKRRDKIIEKNVLQLPLPSAMFFTFSHKARARKYVKSKAKRCGIFAVHFETILNQ